MSTVNDPPKSKLDDNAPLEGAASEGHPRGLYVLFFTELWERFSFYGMRALLSLYLATPRKGSAMYQAYAQQALAEGRRPHSPGLGYAKKPAQAVYHAYGALVYAFPVIGGKLADNLLGYRSSIILGGLLMALGQFMMMVKHEAIFYCALGLIAVGNGFFKPNISSLVGKLYAPGDARRDSGFTIFYMGINIGALLAPLVCGTIGERYGWTYGFALAGVGMLVGLANFVVRRPRLEGHGEPPDPQRLRRPVIAGMSRLHLIALAALLSVPIVAVGLWKNVWVAYVLYGVGAAVLTYLLYLAFTSGRIWRDRMFLVLVLMLFHTSFWAVFEQAGSSFTFLTDKFVNRTIFGFEIPTSAFQALNPILIVTFAPLFAKLWVTLHKVGKNPSIPMKFSWGNVLAGLGFFVLVLGGQNMTGDGGGMKMPLIWIFGTYLLHTLGELCLSPVGLSAITKLAPEKAVGSLMGAWFLTISFAHELAGAIAGATTPPGFDLWAPAKKLAQYTAVYWQVGLVVVGLGVLLGLLSRPLNRLGHGVQ